MKVVDNRQQQILNLMVRYGGGFWQPDWILTGRQQLILNNLEKQGVIRKVGERRWQVVMSTS